jgi:hydroxypyruvate isomerase
MTINAFDSDLGSRSLTMNYPNTNFVDEIEAESDVTFRYTSHFMFSYRKDAEGLSNNQPATDNRIVAIPFPPGAASNKQ